MAWVRKEDDAPMHPKFFRAGVAAYGFHDAALCYCNRYLTDGFIPARDLPLIFPGTPPEMVMELTERLVREGLLDVREDGYQMHDYLDYQPSRKALLLKRKRLLIAGRKGGEKTRERHRAFRLATMESAMPSSQSKPSQAKPSQAKEDLLRNTVSPAVPGTPAAPLTADGLIDLFNAQTPDNVPSVQVRSPERIRKAKQYLARFPRPEFWQTVFAQYRRSAFLRGETAKRNGHETFTPDFDWLLSKGKDGTENAVKVHDGRYSDGGR